MPFQGHPPMLFTSRSSHYLGRRITAELIKWPAMQDVTLCEPHVVKFANENLKVRIHESVRGRDVFLIATSVDAAHSPSGVNPTSDDTHIPLAESLMELLITLDALSGASVGRVTVVAPYFPYVRSDKKDEPRVSIAARLMSRLLAEAGADRVLTINLHALQIMGFMPMPCDQLDANPLIAEYFRSNYDTSNIGVLATDAGGVKIATVYADRLNVPLAICDKRRWGDNQDPEVRSVIGIDEIRGRKIAIFDDEILTGGTMCRAITTLQERFGIEVSYVGCVHAAFDHVAAERILATGVRQIVTTDTLPPPEIGDKVHVVSVAQLIAAAINNIHTNMSVTQIFRDQEQLFKF
jgi:ribose-phosphate pyrophosphokinase